MDKKEAGKNVHLEMRNLKQTAAETEEQRKEIFLLSILYLKPPTSLHTVHVKNTRNELARLVMGTISQVLQEEDLCSLVLLHLKYFLIMCRKKQGN